MPPASIPEPGRAPACPGCGKPAEAPFRPFCGQGCRDRDLLQWLSDGHRLPGPPADLDEDAANGLDSPPDPRL